MTYPPPRYPSGNTTAPDGAVGRPGPHTPSHPYPYGPPHHYDPYYQYGPPPPGWIPPPAEPKEPFWSSDLGKLVMLFVTIVIILPILINVIFLAAMISSLPSGGYEGGDIDEPELYLTAELEVYENEKAALTLCERYGDDVDWGRYHVSVNGTTFYDLSGSPDRSACKAFDLEFWPDGSNAIRPGQPYHVEVYEPSHNKLIWEGNVYAQRA